MVVLNTVLSAAALARDAYFLVIVTVFSLQTNRQIFRFFPIPCIYSVSYMLGYMLVDQFALFVISKIHHLKAKCRPNKYYV